MMNISFEFYVELLGKATRCAALTASRAIHRRTQLLCRRDSPRNAFVPQIRVERGTDSALTADADEFGATRAQERILRAQKKRR